MARPRHCLSLLMQRSTAVLEHDRVDHLPVITPASTLLRRPVRQQRLDACPLGVSQRHTDQQSDDPNERSEGNGLAAGACPLHTARDHRRRAAAHCCDAQHQPSANESRADQRGPGPGSAFSGGTLAGSRLLDGDTQSSRSHPRHDVSRTRCCRSSHGAATGPLPHRACWRCLTCHSQDLDLGKRGSPP